MIKLGGRLGYWILSTMYSNRQSESSELSSMTSVDYVQRIQTIIGPSELDLLKTKRVVDFGCGTGHGAMALANLGFNGVIGFDIRNQIVEEAKTTAEKENLSNRCQFTTNIENLTCDVIVTVDAFEHFNDPADVLSSMSRILMPGGKIIASFGPTWLHPRGGHWFSVFPWAHLIFSEQALCRWRRDFKTDGAQRFSEVEGGLNQMTISRFKKLVSESSLQLEQFTLRPIRSVSWLHNRITHEFFTSIVDCVLTKTSE